MWISMHRMGEAKITKSVTRSQRHVNPLSFLLSKYEGYSIGKTKRTKNISHLFFVHDLKLYALNLNKMIEMLKMVVQFSEDVGMNFGVNKSAYQCIEWGKRK